MIAPQLVYMRHHSGTIAAGGTAQVVYNPKHATTPDCPRNYFLFQNVSDEDMTIDFDRPAVAGQGILVAAGLAWEPPAGIIFAGFLSVLGATTGKAFVCKIA